jgi:cytoskeletal protein CcmA (bactofilin family)
MRRDELLRRLEERLARGEIGEETYLQIKARYDAMPEEPEPPDVPPPPPPAPEGRGKMAGLDLETLIGETIEKAMAQVAQTLEAAVGSEEFERQMEDVGRRMKRAFARFGPRVEAGGKRIVISGSGVVTSDKAVDVFKCAGSAKVTSDLRAKEVRISGSCKIAGSCECQEFHSSGAVKIGSDLRAQEFHSSGSVKVGSDLRAQEVATSGALGVGGSILDAQEVKVSGKLLVANWVRTQEFASSGRFEIGEGIEAQEVRVRLAGTSRVPTIKAQEIDVRRGRRNGELEAKTIEGNRIYLESTRARLVRGKKVRIGPFCTIDVVEAEELEVHERAAVKEQRRLTAAEGTGP